MFNFEPWAALAIDNAFALSTPFYTFFLFFSLFLAHCPGLVLYSSMKHKVLTQSLEERRIRLMRLYGYLVYRHGRTLTWTKTAKATVKAELLKYSEKLTLYPFAYFEGAAIAEAVRP